MDMKQDISAKQCVNCPGATDHDTAHCPTFQKVARLAGYTNFTRNGRVYAHADLETFWRGYKAAKAQPIAAQSAPAVAVPETHALVPVKPTPETVWVRLLDVMRLDNGGDYLSSTRDFDEARGALVELIRAGFFRSGPANLDDDYWMAAAGEQSEAAARFPAVPYARLSVVLNRVFERADEPTQPAARQEQGDEVRRLREALEVTRDTIDGQLEIIASRAPGNYLDKLPVVRSLKAHRARCDAALSASAEGKA